jgi:hypothetical protein
VATHGANWVRRTQAGRFVLVYAGSGEDEVVQACVARRLTAYVESVWGAVPGLFLARLPRPLAEPGVPVSGHRAFVSRRELLRAQSAYRCKGRFPRRSLPAAITVRVLRRGIWGEVTYVRRVAPVEDTRGDGAAAGRRPGAAGRHAADLIVLMHTSRGTLVDHQGLSGPGGVGGIPGGPAGLGERAGTSGPRRSSCPPRTSARSPRLSPRTSSSL